MKSASKYLVILIAFFILSLTTNAQAQWTTTGNNIYNTNTGNVGIGTTSPLVKLDINGNIQTNATIQMTGTGTGTYNRAVIYNDLSNNWLFERARTTNSPSGAITDFIISQRYGGTPGLIVKGSGNVGIGTATPAYKLDVNGSLNAASVYSNGVLLTPGGGCNWTVSGSNIYRSAGNVGIGTTSPGSKLEVSGDLYLSNGASRTIKVTDFNSSSAQYNLSIQGGNNSNSTTGTFGSNMYLAGGGGAWGGGAVYISGGNGTSVKGNVILAHNGTTAIGNVLIGKSSQLNSAYRLDVAGSVRVNEIVVNTDGSDFVFGDSYNLKPLDELEKEIKTQKHLPNIASAKEMQENGMKMGEIQTKLIQKVEELTLYVIQLKKENESLKQRVVLIENGDR